MILNEIKRMQVLAGLITEEEKTASDGGYYSSNNGNIIVSKEEAEFIKNEADNLKNQLFLGEKVAFIGPKDELKREIIQKLQSAGIKLDYDNEEDEEYWWITNEEDIQTAEEEFDAIVNNLFDKIEN